MFDEILLFLLPTNERSGSERKPVSKRAPFRAPLPAGGVTSRPPAGAQSGCAPADDGKWTRNCRGACRLFRTPDNSGAIYLRPVLPADSFVRGVFVYYTITRPCAVETAHALRSRHFLGRCETHIRSGGPSAGRNSAHSFSAKDSQFPSGGRRPRRQFSFSLRPNGESCRRRRVFNIVESARPAAARRRPRRRPRCLCASNWLLAPARRLSRRRLTPGVVWRPHAARESVYRDRRHGDNIVTVTQRNTAFCVWPTNN
ncbi:hypothetical protein EVAR_31181_1 [Eumeta japonica]|uniref:Uncharacterized protein n=1 Tax=Eumeta variegata TaxID=151549 RepID=A0A4C1VZN1_EUMVA|nr:hypothetical protein EVAR_31181_1 [Eumeta japonica]